MQQIALDIRTLSFITMCISLIFALGIYIYGIMQKKFKGFTLLALANTATAAGLALLGLQDALPALFTIVAANTLVIAGYVLYFEGSRRFLDTADSVHPIGIAAILLNIGLFIYFTYQFPSVNHRIIGASAIAAFVSVLSAREFIRVMPDYWRVPGTLMALIFGGSSILHVSRMIWTLGENRIQSLMTTSTVHAFPFIFGVMFIAGMTFGFIWMVSKKLEFELTELANHDQLTNILNRRGVETLVDWELSKLSRIDTALSIIMIDLDHFKNVNDCFGHHIGDEVLAGFAKLVSQNLRVHDIFGRMGGEEFIMVLPSTTLDQALILAERLRMCVEEFVFEFEGHKIQITASFGVTHYVSETRSLQKMIQFADKALYLSKQQGRNKVTSYNPTVDEN